MAPTWYVGIAGVKRSWLVGHYQDLGDIRHSNSLRTRLEEMTKDCAHDTARDCTPCRGVRHRPVVQTLRGVFGALSEDRQIHRGYDLQFIEVVLKKHLGGEYRLPIAVIPCVLTEFSTKFF
jgi:hypothetical protein